ncbi:MAG: hypoxanthine phosphoribosyltransferase [Anaerolineae bacterium]|nr:hypoxanthine phosphoribosyltransferase [Anaerolineae bacterium]MDW8071506.1 hypoxanthine phosphoribosyltransferase [Anaerolineae bacterium]
MDDDIARVLITEEELRRRTRELGQQISRDYQGKDLHLICVLKGGVTFLVDLMREICIPHSIDFMATSSYGDATETSGVVRILKDLDLPIAGRNVLIVDDIIDSGLTIAYLRRILLERQPASLRICTLLNKKERRVVDVPLDYIGFDIPNEFVVGYGMDFRELYRNLRFVGVLKPELYRP